MRKRITVGQHCAKSGFSFCLSTHSVGAYLSFKELPGVKIPLFPLPPTDLVESFELGLDILSLEER